jgi:hypothetical protein
MVNYGYLSLSNYFYFNLLLRSLEKYLGFAATLF